MHHMWWGILFMAGMSFVVFGLSALFLRGAVRRWGGRWGGPERGRCRAAAGRAARRGAGPRWRSSSQLSSSLSSSDVKGMSSNSVLFMMVLRRWAHTPTMTI
jgi:hypothetical protein